MPSVPKTSTAKATVAELGELPRRVRLIHRLESKRHPGTAERFRIDAQDVGDRAAQLIDADVRERAGEPQKEPVGHHGDLLQQRVGDQRQAETQHLPSPLPRGASDGALDHAGQAGDQDDRGEQVGQHDAEHAHAEADHQQQASRRGAEAAAHRPAREPGRLIADPEQAVGDAEERLQEAVQGEQPERPGMLGRAEQQAAERGGASQQQDASTTPLARPMATSVVPVSVRRAASSPQS